MEPGSVEIPLNNQTYVSNPKNNDKEKINDYHDDCQINKNPPAFNLAINLGPLREHKK
jgi:hypothetical protein